jgi:hypothetical protein
MGTSNEKFLACCAGHVHQLGHRPLATVEVSVEARFPSPHDNILAIFGGLLHKLGALFIQLGPRMHCFSKLPCRLENLCVLTTLMFRRRQRRRRKVGRWKVRASACAVVVCLASPVQLCQECV